MNQWTNERLFNIFRYIASHLEPFILSEHLMVCGDENISKIALIVQHCGQDLDCLVPSKVISMVSSADLRPVAAEFCTVSLDHHLSIHNFSTVN